MDIQDLIRNSSYSELEAKVLAMASDGTSASMDLLEEFLVNHVDYPGYNQGVMRLVTLAMLKRGAKGVVRLSKILYDNPGAKCSVAIIDTIWCASKGRVPAHLVDRVSLSSSIGPLDKETVDEAKRAIHDVFVEARQSPDLFDRLLFFLYQYNMTFGLMAGESDSIIREEIYAAMTAGVIKLSERLIEQFQDLIDREVREEEYQIFLSRHPVFLDPLAAEVVPKQKLGLEFVTDYAVRLHDGKHVLVEIERPQDSIFTASNDFSSRFNHSFGQVLDFQRWVESNNDYARKLMPGIASPRGMLVIGRRSRLEPEGADKLRRFSANSMTIDVVTFDDLIERARSLLRSIRHEASGVD